MKLRVIVMLVVGVLALSGCQNKNQQQQTAHTEEPYTPSYTSLDAMESTPPSGTPAYTPAAEPVANTTNVSPADNSDDEPLNPTGGQVYTVRKGDTFYSLARRFYSDQARWRDIWEANKNRVPDPDKLAVGIKLIIP